MPSIRGRKTDAASAAGPGTRPNTIGVPERDLGDLMDRLDDRNGGHEGNMKRTFARWPFRHGSLKLLLEHGASPNTPEDEYPPVTYAIRDRNQEIALALVAGGMDLKRRYGAGTRSLTLGDMALRAEMPELVELIRERGGPFTETR